MEKRGLSLGLAWIGLSILCWMPMFSIGKRTLVHIDAFALATARYLLGVVLFVLLLATVEGWKSLRYEGRFVPATALGLTGITGFNLFIWIGLAYTRPEHAAIIVQLQTPLTALALWIVRGQRPAVFTLACVVAAILGVFIVVTRGEPLAVLSEADSARVLFGDLLVLLAAVAWVIYTLGSRVLAGWSALRMTVLTCFPGTVGIVGAHALALALGWVPVPTVTMVAAVSWQIVYFAVCTVVLGILGFNAAARHLGPLNTMLMLNIVPVGVFAIEAALGRSYVPMELIGAAIVIAALVANNLYLRRASTSR